MWKMFYFLGAILYITTPMVAVADDAFDMTGDIVEAGEIDVTAENVDLNSGADVAAVASFDIGGVMLGMKFEDIKTLFFDENGLYTPRRNNSIIYTIYPDWKHNLDYECRMDGIFVPAELETCVNSLARARGLLYASEIHLERPNTGETITVYLTSNATENVVWRVVYNNDVNDLDGDGEKFQNQRDKKVLVFWQSVLDKYGVPNSGTDKWITSTNSYDPMMTAYYGALDLVDMGRRASDAAMNVSQSREHFHAKPYAF